MRRRLTDDQRAVLVRRPLVLVMLSMLALTALFGAGLALAASFTINLTPTGPQPAIVTVSWGDTVGFANSGTVTWGLVSPATEIGTTSVGPGETLSAVFTGLTGTMPFHQLKPTGDGFFYGAVQVILRGTLTLSSGKGPLTYGHRLQLRGRLTVAPGSRVTIQRRRLNQYHVGDGPWSDLLSVPTAADGHFALSVPLPAGAEFRATAAAGQLGSAPIQVLVAPRVTTRVSPRSPKTGQAVTVTVAVLPSRAATGVSLERYDPASRKWLLVLARRLSGSGSSKLVWRAGPGRMRLRVEITPQQAAAGFAGVTGAPFVVSAK